MSKTLAIIVLSLAAFLAACVSQEQHLDSEQSQADKQAVLHVIEGTELRNAMQRLNNLMLERNLTEPELDSQRRRTILLVLEVVKGAESSLDCILETAQRLKLNEYQLKRFHALANKLRVEAKTLRIQAETHQLSSIPATLDKMNNTCTSCHALFRSI